MTDKEMDESWERFEGSGNIIDYLAYRGNKQANGRPDRESWGVEHYGANHHTDRDGAVSAAYRGI